MSKKKAKENKEVEIIGLFNPIQGKDIRDSYPELRKVKEFDNMNKHDFRFCWSMVYEFGELANERQKIAKSIFSAYGNTLHIDKQESYKNYNFPDHIRVGIERLKNYDLSARLKARAIVENQMNFFLEMSRYDIKDYEDENGEIENDKVAKYAQVAKIANDLIPDLIKKMEHNYSVSDDVYEEYKNNYGSVLDKFHKQNQK